MVKGVRTTWCKTERETPTPRATNLGDKGVALEEEGQGLTDTTWRSSVAIIIDAAQGTDLVERERD